MFLIKIIIIILFYIPIEEDYGFINSINLGDYINSINSINLGDYINSINLSYSINSINSINLSYSINSINLSYSINSINFIDFQSLKQVQIIVFFVNQITHFI